MQKKILLHTCCGPCSIYPIKVLREEFEIYAFFYKSNIHPVYEMEKRLKTLEEYLKKENIPIIYEDDYKPEKFLEGMNKDERCGTCYNKRFSMLGQIAQKENFKFFSSTLLYSRFQNHNLIKETAEDISKKVNVQFYYKDFRLGWNEGVLKSKELGMYRQKYCGCIYSLSERLKVKRKIDNG